MRMDTKTQCRYSLRLLKGKRDMEEAGFTFENLLRAAKECARGVHWKNSVVKWQENLPRFCLRLERELAEGTFKWSESVKMLITSPKKRIVNSQRFRDRVVQRCMCNGGLYEDLTRGNVYDNGACQNGKGTLFMRNRLKCHLQRHYRKYGDAGWVLSLDVKRFFDSIPHDKLVSFIFQRVKSNRHRWMVRDLIRMGGTEGTGLELGSQISQLMAVGYLSPIDYFAKRVARIEGYVRYCDDIVILIPPECVQPEGTIVAGREVAMALKGTITKMLFDLGLSLNPKSTIYPIRQGIKFLGFRHRLTSGGGVLDTPLQKQTRKEKRKITKLMNKQLSPEAVVRHFNAWAGYYKHCKGKQQIHKLERRLNEYEADSKKSG